MLLPRPEDALHIAQLHRLLIAIVDTPALSQQLYFKGRTCAAMAGYLDRFSIDLDFDLKPGAQEKTIHQHITSIAAELDYDIVQKSSQTLFYVLKYTAPAGDRNTIKLSVVDAALQSNIYEPLYLADIDRYAICQTKETMFANKLVAITDRYKKYRTIAGRDIYDVHAFFLKGFRYREEIIEERTGKKVPVYLKELQKFVQHKVTDKLITEDLNFLLSDEAFKIIRKVLKREVLMFLENELHSAREKRV